MNEQDRSARFTAAMARAVPRDVHRICGELRKAGHRSWLVGGCVRDELILAESRGKSDVATHRNDWDIATDAHPEDVRALFRRVIPTGIQHGTVTVLMGKVGYEVTTLRGEGAYSDGRRPDSVHFVDDITEDLARRDFTINAIAYDVLNGELLDPFGGLWDIAERRLRAVGVPAERFGEDGLRVLRAARFVATLEFELEPETAAAIRPSLSSYAKVSAERIRDEWYKSMKARSPSRAFDVMREHGMLDITAPELLSDEAKLELAAATMDACPLPAVLRLTGLLWAAGEQGAARIAARLKCSNADRERIVALIRHVNALPSAASSGADLRRFLRDVSLERLDDLLALAHAHVAAGAPLDVTETQTLATRLREIVAQSPPLHARDLAISGNDLKRELGLAPGPKIGVILHALLERVIEDPAENTRAALLAHARELV